MITAEEFIKSKIRRRDNITGGMFGLWYYKLNAEEAESWMIEFAEKQANEDKTSDESVRVCPKCGTKDNLWPTGICIDCDPSFD